VNATPESGFYVTLQDRIEIVRLMREIPELVEELAITTSRQARMGSGGPQISTGKFKERPLFFNEFSAEITEDLRGVLVGWVRHVLEYRESAAWPEDSILTLARWLDHHVVALAMTPGSEEFLDEIRDAMGRAWRAVDRRVEAPPRAADPDRVDEARESLLNAVEIARQRAQFGEPYAGLNYDRIMTLKGKGAITPAEEVSTENGPMSLYRLGDVLDAHLAYPSRQRKSKK
jgi:hypothetical protein